MTKDPVRRREQDRIRAARYRAAHPERSRASQNRYDWSTKGITRRVRAELATAHRALEIA